MLQRGWALGIMMFVALGAAAAIVSLRDTDPSQSTSARSTSSFAVKHYSDANHHYCSFFEQSSGELTSLPVRIHTATGTVEVLTTSNTWATLPTGQAAATSSARVASGTSALLLVGDKEIVPVGSGPTP